MLPFDFNPTFDGPLVPPSDDWPLFDAILFCSLDSSSSSDQSPSPPLKSDPLPSTATLASMPIPPSRTSPRNRNPNHIPRPRNAFMLFRSAFAAAQKVSAKIEHDNRHITRIIAHCWNRLSDADKQVWRDKAAAEKAQHAERYPNYRFSPTGRTNKPTKRNVRRNGAEDVKRCEKLAELVMAGKCGQELESAIKQIDSEFRFVERSDSTDLNAFTNPETRWTNPQDPKPANVPPFLCPLLPPTKTTGSQQAFDEDSVPQSLVCVATPHHVDSQAFDYSIDPDMRSVFGPPRFQYHQLNACDEVSSSVPILHPSHFQPAADVVQSSHAELEQSALDFRLFSWNQSDSFSYYNC